MSTFHKMNDTLTGVFPTSKVCSSADVQDGEGKEDEQKYEDSENQQQQHSCNSSQKSDAEIVVLSKIDETLREEIHIVTGNGQKTSVKVLIESDPSKGWTIGRALITGVDLLCTDERFIGIDDPKASKTHCKIFRTQAGVLHICDLRSRNGTRINGQTIWPGEERVLKHDDTVAIGASKIKLAAQHATSDAATTKEDSRMSIAQAELEDNITCYFCQLNLSKFSILERSLHINSCVESKQHNDAVIVQELVEGAAGCVIETVCVVCGKALDKLSEVQRASHVNKCLDKQQQHGGNRGMKSPSAVKRQESKLKPPTAVQAAAAVKKGKSLTSGNKGKRESTSEPSAPANLRFTFTKQISGIVADEDHEYHSDQEVFECDPHLLERTRQLQHEAREIAKEDVEVVFKRIKVGRIEHALNEKQAREVLLSGQTTPMATSFRFPSPYRPKVLLSKDSLLRKRKHFEAQLRLIDDLLIAVEGGNVTHRTAHESEKASSSLFHLTKTMTVGDSPVHVNRLIVEEVIEVKDVLLACAKETEVSDKERCTKLIKVVDRPPTNATDDSATPDSQS